MDEMTIKYLPESPSIGGFYAVQTPRTMGKLGTQSILGTFSAKDAIQFDTFDQCEEWCDDWNEHNKGKFNPVEHGFY